MSSRRSCGRARSPNRRAQAGDLLIEVLIAILVTAIGLLGVAAMQAMALRNSGSALQRGQAAVQIHSILDAMRGNSTNAAAYALSRTCTAPSDTSTLAAYDLSEWIASLHTTLGSTACGTISCTSGTVSSQTYYTCTVTVDWDDSRANDLGSSGVANGASTYTVSTTARL
ncbi:MAG: hypothetical protein QM581_07150 [Pseudomonas sp.]